MRIFVLLACVLAFAVPLICQNESLGLGGLVLNPDGQPIEGAFVLIRDYRQPSAGYVSDKWESRTAADGSFSLSAPRGCYDVFISANLQLLPFAGRICTQPELHRLRIKLKADPHPVLLKQ